MDCNYETALVTKEKAERKFAEEDYVEAKKLAQQAKDLFPELKFIDPFIMVIDIYLSRQKTVNDQPDWHAVLGLENPATIEETCTKYFNLFEDVKIGKNGVIGAEGALQILSEAFCMLTGVFWTMCPMCQFEWQYSTERINKDMVCFNCHKLYLAVPLPFGTHPTSPKTMSHFPRLKRKWKAPSAEPVGESGTSKVGKKRGR